MDIYNKMTVISYDSTLMNLSCSFVNMDDYLFTPMLATQVLTVLRLVFPSALMLARTSHAKTNVSPNVTAQVQALWW